MTYVFVHAVVMGIAGMESLVATTAQMTLQETMVLIGTMAVYVNATKKVKE